MPIWEYLTREEILQLGDTDPEDAAWRETNTCPKLNWRDPLGLRALREPHNREVFESLGDPGLDVQVPMRDGYTSSLRIYKPKGPTTGSPLIVLLFGGAFLTGDNRQLASYALALRAVYRGTVVLPSYRLALEHLFPTAQNDVWDTLVWLSQHA